MVNSRRRQESSIDLWSRSSTTKVSPVTGNDGQVAQQPHSMLTEEDPLAGQARLSIPKFKGDK